MMRKLDRYIIKKFFTVLLFTTLAFIVIFIVVDLIEHLDKFLASKAGITKTFVYYIYYIPYITILTLPVNMLLSSLFSLGGMAQHNELIASLSAGISFYRLVLPLLVLAFLISVLSGIAAETIVPDANRARLDIYRYEIRNQPRVQAGTQRRISLQDKNNRQVSIEYYETRLQKAQRVNIVWKDKNQILERWDIKYMKWDKTRQKWLMHEIIQRQFSDTSEAVTRLDTLWLRDSNITPNDLVDLQVKQEEMNYQELSRFVDKMRNLGADVRKWMVDLYLKISYPFACFIIVLFGIPLASQKRRSGPALGFALALLISFIYFILIRSGQVLGYNGTLSPWLAAWIGNIVFGIGGVALMLAARK